MKTKNLKPFFRSSNGLLALLVGALAMQPGWTLANAERIQISARLSLSGQVLNDENGPQVQSEVLSFNEPKLSLSLSLQP